jgi:hypothetical protein
VSSSSTDAETRTILDVKWIEVWITYSASIHNKLAYQRATQMLATDLRTAEVAELIHVSRRFFKSR